VQPPGRPLPFGTPLAVKTPGAGQVVSVGEMKSSIAKGSLAKWLVSSQSALSGGDVRLTSACSKQEYGAPSWPTCSVCAASAWLSPFTPSQPP
jgi:hypothetical protein